MGYLNKSEIKKIVKELRKIKNKEILNIIEKLESIHKKLEYVHDKSSINKLLRQAFKEKRKVKICYYSLSSDKTANRIINIYQLHSNCVVAYCNLRKDERTFVVGRIIKAALLDETYKIPEDWRPESIILSK